VKKLQLVLKKKWFDMIASGEKREEYREITDYWTRRLTEYRPDLPNFGLPGKVMRKFNTVRFRNGYQKNAPVVERECLGITVREGREKWGAEPGKYYFVISLGGEVAL
jgi:hypothetical protein